MEAANKEFLLQQGLVAGEVLGRGSFGTVYRCTKFEKEGMRVFAVKVINLKMLKLEQEDALIRLDREISVMKRLNHPNIVKLFETFTAPDAMFLVMELVLGLDLYEMILAKQGLQDETEAQFIFKELCLAVQYMHSKGILHRDIKPENVIIQNERYDQTVRSETAGRQKFNYSVKLIDFGLSKVIRDIKSEADQHRAEDLGSEALGSAPRSLVGTPRYVAPEIVAESVRAKMQTSTDVPYERKAYTAAVDCYSMGVLLHVMLGACFPQFESGNVYFKDARIARASDEAKDLITQLLQKDPERRMDLKTAINAHPWLNKTPRSQTKRGNINDGDADDVETSASFLDFQEKLLRGIEKMDTNIGEGYESDVSVESISVGEPVAERLRQMSKEQDNTLAGHITGLKRQASQGASNTVNNVMKDSSSRSVVNGSDNLPDAEGSKSSIEIDLPGAKSGIWGLRSSGRADSTEQQESTRLEQQEMETSVTDLAELSQPLQAFEEDGTVTATMVDPDRLIGLQAKIAASLKAAYREYSSDPKIAPGIVASAVGSHELLRSAESILQKLDHTALSVLNMLPDLQLAVEEGEFGMAVTTFATIKEWIQTLKAEAKTLLVANVGVIASVNNTILLVRERQRESLRAKQENKAPIAGLTNIVDMINERINDGKQVEVEEVASLLRQTSFSSDEVLRDDKRDEMKSRMKEIVDAAGKDNASPVELVNQMAVILQEKGVRAPMETESPVENLSKALLTLQEVDKLLQQHASFWSHMEVVIQVLMHRADHVESLTHFTRNPRLRGRFMKRLGEYADTWNGVRRMCQSFSVKSHSVTPYLYKFLQEPGGSPKSEDDIEAF